jgi:hypothetical protein
MVFRFQVDETLFPRQKPESHNYEVKGATHEE